MSVAEPPKALKAIVLDPGGRFEVKEIPDTLEGLQEAVGGIIGLAHVVKGLLLVYHDEAILEDLDPNLWGLVIGTPFQGPLVLVREAEPDRRIDVTAADVAAMERLRGALRRRLEEVGLVAAPPYMRFVPWPSEDQPH